MRDIKFDINNENITITGPRLQKNEYDYSKELQVFCGLNNINFWSLGEAEGSTIDGEYQEKININNKGE